MQGYSLLLWRTALEKFGKTPLLTDGEMEAQYKMVYNRAMSRGDASAQVNLVRASFGSFHPPLISNQCARSVQDGVQPGQRAGQPGVYLL